MSDVWGNDTGRKFVHDLCEEFGAVFATTCLLRPGGQQLAAVTTIDEEGYAPCWQTTTNLAKAAQGGDVFGLTPQLQVDHPRDVEESPKADGAGLRLFHNGVLVGLIGVLGVSVAELIGAVTKVAQEYDLVIAEHR